VSETETRVNKKIILLICLTSVVLGLGVWVLQTGIGMFSFSNANAEQTVIQESLGDNQKGIKYIVKISDSVAINEQAK